MTTFSQTGFFNAFAAAFYTAAQRSKELFDFHLLQNGLLPQAVLIAPDKLHIIESRVHSARRSA